MNKTLKIAMTIAMIIAIIFTFSSIVFADANSLIGSINPKIDNFLTEVFL